MGILKSKKNKVDNSQLEDLINQVLVRFNDVEAKIEEIKKIVDSWEVKLKTKEVNFEGEE